MAKAILKYDLNDPDDRMDHLRALKSLDLSLVIWEFYYNVKKGMESRIEEENLDGYETLDALYKKFQDILDEHSIDIDDYVQ